LIDKWDHEVKGGADCRKSFTDTQKKAATRTASEKFRNVSEDQAAAFCLVSVSIWLRRSYSGAAKSTICSISA
jgi:hypothetical protein